MAGQLFSIQAFNGDGTFAPGAKIRTFRAGTTIPQSLFADEAGTIPLANPLVLNAAGIGAAWAKTDGGVFDYKFDIVSNDNSTILLPTIDNYTPNVDNIYFIIGTNIASSLAAALDAQEAAELAQQLAETAAANAAVSAGTATTQAGIATTQAGIATTGGTTATTQAGISTAQAVIATTQAGIATTQAGNAATSAAAALVSENAAELAQTLTQAFSDADVNVPVEGQDILTFNPATAVNTTTNVITINAHGLIEDDQVTYRHGGGTVIAGLTHDAEYFAVATTTNTFALSLTRGGAPIDLTSVGTGTAHQFLPVRSSKHHAFYSRQDALDAYSDAALAAAIRDEIDDIFIGEYANAAAAVAANPGATANQSFYYNTTEAFYHVLTSVSPALSVVLATAFATEGEVLTGTLANKAVSPATLTAKLAGIVVPTIATQAEAVAATNNTKISTPLRVKEAIRALESYRSIAAFNPVADLTANDTVTLDAAFLAANSRGGRLVIPCSMRLRVSTTLVVPNNFEIIGETAPLGHGNPSAIANFGPIIFVDSGVTILLGDSSKVKGCAIFRTGLTFNITKAQVLATFLGTAFTIREGSTEATVEDCIVLGFNLGISSIIGATQVSRVRLRRNNWDCITAIRLENSLDVTYISENHAWPFVTVSSAVEAGDAHLTRPGRAIHLIGTHDWTRLTNNFSFGYQRGVEIQDSDSVEIVGGAADHPPAAISDGSIGVLIAGDAFETIVVGFQTAAKTHAIYASTTATDNIVLLTNCIAWEFDDNGIVVEHGRVIDMGCAFRRTGAAGSTNGALLLGNADVSYTKIGGRFSGVANGINAVATNLPFFHDGVDFANTVTPVPLSYKFVAASAATLPNDARSTAIEVTGTTGITAIANVAAYRGKIITLTFTGALTITAGATLDMNSNFTSASGEWISFASDGVTWREVARSTAIAAANPTLLFSSGVYTPHTGSTAETTKYTIAVPAGAIGANGFIEIEGQFLTFNTPNAKNVRLKLGGVEIMNFNAASGIQGHFRRVLRNRNAQNDQAAFDNASPGGFGVSAVAFTGYTIDTSVAQNLTLTVQLANSGEEVNFLHLAVKIWKMA